MPMSEDFKKRLESVLPEIIENFGTPFIIMDEQGIRNTYQRIDRCLQDVPHRMYFAVKATPIPRILQMYEQMGAGFDCSSIPELQMVRHFTDVNGEGTMFTSNNTTSIEFAKALKLGTFSNIGEEGAIINVDDISLLDKIPSDAFPKTICFRYNPGPRRSGNEIIGKPIEAKYGVPHEEIVEAYRRAQQLGTKSFGLHTMICSNAPDSEYLVDTVQMLRDVAQILFDELGIRLDFINMGGGLGIPYHPNKKEVDIEKMFAEIVEVIKSLGQYTGKIPKLLMEFGRYMTGPHGVLIMKVINRMEKYRTIIGVDASMPCNPRPATYESYHHITVHNKARNLLTKTEIVDVGGSLCEGCDKFAVQRVLPVLNVGDTLMQHDVGAHAIAMGGDYNFRFQCQVLLLTTENEVVCIRPEKTYENHMSVYHNEGYGKTIKL